MEKSKVYRLIAICIIVTGIAVASYAVETSTAGPASLIGQFVAGIIISLVGWRMLNLPKTARFF